MNLWTAPLRVCASALWLNAVTIMSLAIDRWAPEYALTMRVNNLAALVFGILAIWCWGRK